METETCFTIPKDIIFTGSIVRIIIKEDGEYTMYDEHGIIPDFILDKKDLDKIFEEIEKRRVG